MLGTDTRVPWAAVAGYATSPRALVLGMGRLDVPLVRAFFPTEEEWQSARAVIEKNVPVAPPRANAGAMRVFLWLGVIVVLFLAWHFARIQSPAGRHGTQMEKTL